MSEASVLALQRCLAALALEADPAPFEADPAALAAAHGLPARDQAAFRRAGDRLLTYREGVRAALWEPMDRYCPLTQALLEADGAWEDCRTAFLATRLLASPFYRDVAPTFLGWLASSGWGRDRWPCLLELAHFELVKELVEQGPDDPPDPGLHATPSPGDRVVLAASTQVLTYTRRVFEATLARPEPPPGRCHLLASRGPDGHIAWTVLTEAASSLLVRAREDPITQAAADLGMHHPAEVLSFLEDLRTRGAVLGFR